MTGPGLDGYLPMWELDQQPPTAQRVATAQRAVSDFGAVMGSEPAHGPIVLACSPRRDGRSRRGESSGRRRALAGLGAPFHLRCGRQRWVCPGCRPGAHVSQPGQAPWFMGGMGFAFVAGPRGTVAVWRLCAL